TKTDAGELEAARALFGRCWAAAEELGFYTDLVRVGVNWLYTMYLEGDVEAGSALAKDLEPLVVLPRWRVMYRVNWGLLELEAGRPEEARAHFRLANENVRGLGNAAL